MEKKVIKATSKRGQSYIRSYNSSHDTELHEVYGRWSTEKAVAYNRCRQLCENEGGIGFKIVGHSCNFFSVGWTTPEGDLRIETAYNHYLIPEGTHYSSWFCIQYCLDGLDKEDEDNWEDVCAYDDSPEGYKAAGRDLKEYRESGTEGSYRRRLVFRRED